MDKNSEKISAWKIMWFFNSGVSFIAFSIFAGIELFFKNSSVALLVSAGVVYVLSFPLPIILPVKRPIHYYFALIFCLLYVASGLFLMKFSYETILFGFFISNVIILMGTIVSVYCETDMRFYGKFTKSETSHKEFFENPYKPTFEE